MAEINQKIYKCDICGTKSPDPFKKLILPLPYYEQSDWQMGHNKTDRVGLFGGDVCNKCCKKIINAIEPICDEYGEYAYIGKRIKWKEPTV